MRVSGVAKGAAKCDVDSRPDAPRQRVDEGSSWSPEYRRNEILSRPAAVAAEGILER